MTSISKMMTISLAVISLGSVVACVEPDDANISSEIAESSAKFTAYERMALQMVDDPVDREFLAEAFLRDFATVVGEGEDQGLVIFESAPRSIRERLNDLIEWLCDQQARTCLNCNGEGMTTSLMCPTPACACPDECPVDSLCGGLGAGEIVEALE